MKLTAQNSSSAPPPLTRTDPSPLLSKTRKRLLPVHDAPRSKRHLNTALAAHLETLRISTQNSAPNPLSTSQSATPPSPSSSSPSSVFGTPLPYSPFLGASNKASPPFPSSSSSSSQSSVHSSQFSTPTPASKFTFGVDFSSSLPPVPDEASPTNPAHRAKRQKTLRKLSFPGAAQSGTASQVGEEGKLNPRLIPNSTENPLQPEIEIEDVTDDDPMSTSERTQTEHPENRLIIYNPPVRTTASSVTRLNAQLPPGHLAFRTPHTEDWFIASHPPCPSHKRKRELAVVPWRKAPKRQLCQYVPRLPTVIPMPWHDGFPIFSNSVEESPVAVENMVGPHSINSTVEQPVFDQSSGSTSVFAPFSQPNGCSPSQDRSSHDVKMDNSAI